MTTDDPSALTRLGVAQAAMGDHAAALATYDRALALNPRQPLVLNNRGVSLIELGRAEEAIESLDQALALRPGSAAVLNNRGNALRGLGRMADALASYELALAADPNFIEALGNRALVLVETGRLEAAVSQLEQAIKLHPHTPQFYLKLTELKQLERGDPHLLAMQAIAAAPRDLAGADRIDLHFALGKALADIGDHDRAFAHLREANVLKRRTLAYTIEPMLAAIDETPVAFSRALLNARAGLGDPTDQPIFIVGMPRSGSTLVEQILASHPDAFGAGETGLLQQSISALRSVDASADAAGDEAALWARRTSRLAEGYLGPLRRLAPPDAARIVDKTLENYRLVGQIRLALPNARIIHVMRDPLDTCLSCFSRLFVNVPYSYDLTELGRMYRAYAALMEHWRQVHPGERPAGGTLRGGCSGPRAPGPPHRRALRSRVGCALPSVSGDRSARVHRKRLPSAPAHLPRLGGPLARLRGPSVPSARGAWPGAQAVGAFARSAPAHAIWTQSGPNSVELGDSNRHRPASDSCWMEAVSVTTLPRHFKAAEPAWSPAVGAREIDRLMSRLPTSLIEALLKLESDLPARLAR